MNALEFCYGAFWPTKFLCFASSLCLLEEFSKFAFFGMFPNYYDYDTNLPGLEFYLLRPCCPVVWLTPFWDTKSYLEPGLEFLLTED